MLPLCHGDASPGRPPAPFERAQEPEPGLPGGASCASGGYRTARAQHETPSGCRLLRCRTSGRSLGEAPRPPIHRGLETTSSIPHYKASHIIAAIQ